VRAVPSESIKVIFGMADKMREMARPGLASRRLYIVIRQDAPEQLPCAVLSAGI
jgi:hypothetical protein